MENLRSLKKILAYLRVISARFHAEGTAVVLETSFSGTSREDEPMTHDVILRTGPVGSRGEFVTATDLAQGMAELLNLLTQRPDRGSVIPGDYRHWKGGEYEILGVAESTETGEKTVIYRPLTGEHAGKLFSRNLAVFHTEVNNPELSHKGPRFIHIHNQD